MEQEEKTPRYEACEGDLGHGDLDKSGEKVHALLLTHMV